MFQTRSRLKTAMGPSVEERLSEYLSKYYLGFCFVCLFVVFVFVLFFVCCYFVFLLKDFFHILFIKTRGGCLLFLLFIIYNTVTKVARPYYFNT